MLDAVGVVLTLQRNQVSESITTLADHIVRQDHQTQDVTITIHKLNTLVSAVLAPVGRDTANVFGNREQGASPTVDY